MSRRIFQSIAPVAVLFLVLSSALVAEVPPGTIFPPPPPGIPPGQDCPPSNLSADVTAWSQWSVPLNGYQIHASATIHFDCTHDGSFIGCGICYRTQIWSETLSGTDVFNKDFDAFLSIVYGCDSGHHDYSLLPLAWPTMGTGMGPNLDYMVMVFARPFPADATSCGQYNEDDYTEVETAYGTTPPGS